MPASLAAMLRTTVGGERPAKDDLKSLLARAQKALAAQPTLLQVEAPVTVCGDLHGQLPDLLAALQHCGMPLHTKADAAGVPRMLFLGDYVDRGPHSVPVMVILLALLLQYPTRVFLLRGNHESAQMNDTYGFQEEVKAHYSVDMYRRFQTLFNQLPLAAEIGIRSAPVSRWKPLHEDAQFNAFALCMHGGISPELGEDYRAQINALRRPCTIPDAGLACDLLWADPDEDMRASQSFRPSPRGASYCFSEKDLRAFLKTTGLRMVIRAHEMCDEGYRYFAGKGLLTVFSASNYCGAFHNKAAVAEVRLGRAGLSVRPVVLPPCDAP